MPASVTVYEAGPITNLGAVLKSGGDLEPDTQYWVCVFAVGPTTPFDMSKQVIGPHDIVTFSTTTTEKSATISWDAATGDVGGYHVCLTDNLETTPYRGWYGSRIGGSAYTTDQTSWDIDDYSRGNWFLHPFDIIQDYPVGLNKDFGAVVVEVDCDGDQVGPAEIDALIGDASISVCSHSAWFLRGSLVFKPGVVADFIAKGYHIQFLYGALYAPTDPADGSICQFGAEGEVQPCALLSVGNNYQQGYIRGNFIKHYGTRICYQGEYTSNASNVVGTSGGRQIHHLEDACEYNNASLYFAPVFRGQMTVEDTTFFCGVAQTGFYIATVGFALTGVRRIKILSTSGSMAMIYGQALKLYEWTYEKTIPSYHISVGHPSSTAPYELYDWTIVGRDDNTPICILGSVTHETDLETRKVNGIQMYITLGVSVSNPDGDPIVGAAVTVEDSSGATVLSGTTDVDGSISDYVLRVWIYRNTVESGSYEEKMELDFSTPYTVTVSAAGFQDYTWKGSPIEAATIEVGMTPAMAQSAGSGLTVILDDNPQIILSRRS